MEEANLLVQKFLKTVSSIVRENRFWMCNLAWIIVRIDTGAHLVSCVSNLSGFVTKNLEKWGEMQLVAQGSTLWFSHRPGETAQGHWAIAFYST